MDTDVATVELRSLSEDSYEAGSILLTCWGLMHKDDALRYVFWNVTSHVITPKIFFDYFDWHRGCFPFLVLHNYDIAGLAWFEDISGDTASVGIWIRRRYWGEIAEAAGVEILQYGYMNGLKRIYGISPHKHVLRYNERVGMRHIVSLPYGDKAIHWFVGEA